MALGRDAELPPEDTRFFGRQRELAELRAEITRPGLLGPERRTERCRVLLVAGRPGSGRTALAVRLARQVATDYPDGQFFVRLGAPDGEPLRPAQAAARLLTALGRPVPPAAAGDAGDAAACAALRAALTGRRALLVLDDVRDADQLRPLLPEEPGCLVVAVGSGPLTGVPDVRPCVLGGLDLAASVALLADLAGETRIAVDPVAARRLAEEADCHPAALHLLGGWLRSRPRASVTDALRRLGEVLLPRPGSLTGAPAAGAAAVIAAATRSADPARPDAAAGPRKDAAASGAAGAPGIAAPGTFGTSGTSGAPAALPGGSGAPGGAPAAGAGSGGVRPGGGGAAGGAPPVPGAPAGRAADGAAQARPGGARQAAAYGPEGGAGARRDGGAAGRPAVRPEDGAAAGRPVGGAGHGGGAQGGADGASAAAARPAGPVLQAALARVFTMVYEDLPGAPARLLRLSVLAPGGVLDARTASALLGCPVPDAEALLHALEEQQLLRAEAALGGPRHRVPACLRGTLQALLAGDRPAETELARARMLERMVRLLGAATALLNPEAAAGSAAAEQEALPAPLRFRSRAQAWDWLDGTLPALRAAARDAVDGGGLDGIALRLIGGLVRAVPLHHRLAHGVDARRAAAAVSGELFELHALVLELSRRGGLPRRAAAALVNMGDLHAAAGRHRQALDQYRAALGPARASDDDVAVGRILEAVAGAYAAAGDPVRSADWYRRALAFRRNRGERRDEVRLLGRLAGLHAAHGRHREALREYRAVVALLRRLGDDSGAVRALLGAARVQELSGDVEPALGTAREALAVARSMGAARSGGATPARAAAAPGAPGPGGEAGDAVRLQVAVLHWLADALERAGDPAGARVQREQAESLLPRG